MIDVCKKMALGAFAAAALMMGPLPGEANAAGGCAAKKELGQSCGGRPERGGGRVGEYTLEDGPRSYRLEASKCEWKNIKLYKAAGWDASKVAWIRCPNKTVEETKRAVLKHFQ
jgi:hypothetical protein